jgi:hypothetical protein
MHGNEFSLLLAFCQALQVRERRIAATKGENKVTTKNVKNTKKVDGRPASPIGSSMQVIYESGANF